MKKVILSTLVIGVASFAVTSCKKCKDCHYDGPSGEVELGEYCDDAIADIESSGHYDSATDSTYEVHCSEHE